MNLSALQHYLLVPDREKNGRALLYILEPAKEFCSPGFVIVPYNRPGEAIAPNYYSIVETVSTVLPAAQQSGAGFTVRPLLSRAEYLEKLATLKSHIRRGDIYEINYCTTFDAEQVHIDPLTVFARLYQLSKAPYSCLFKSDDTYILCASPELFLEKKGDVLVTKPIKGTTRRGNTAEEDNKLKQELQGSLKERTENVMAVDVARNDLSILAKRGTVTADPLYAIETFQTVHQMVSTVRCVLRNHITFEDILNATFPMASMTGAPKLSARLLCDEHEDFARAFYSGTMGLIDEQGDFTLSVTIRSIFYNSATGSLSIAVGGAITHLSDPENEYQECLLKARAMLSALNAVIA